jgi:hypothetical protein
MGELSAFPCGISNMPELMVMRKYQREYGWVLVSHLGI